MGLTVLVYDERFESGPRFVESFANVPENWTTQEIMRRYGISPHLSVYIGLFKPRNCVHIGTRYDKKKH